MALCDTTVITAKDLPPDLIELSVDTFEDTDFKSLEEMEKDYIQKVLIQTGNHKVRASDILKIPRVTLWRKIKRFGLE